jgi:hypothetical protein
MHLPHRDLKLAPLVQNHPVRLSLANRHKRILPVLAEHNGKNHSTLAFLRGELARQVPSDPVRALPDALKHGPAVKLLRCPFTAFYKSKWLAFAHKSSATKCALTVPNVKPPQPPPRTPTGRHAAARRLARAIFFLAALTGFLIKGYEQKTVLC